MKDQQSRVKELITLGKERGYLTYGEINDHLPEDLVDADQVEDIVSMFSDLGIMVHEDGMDTDEMERLAEAAASNDDISDDEAAAVLSSSDGEFGRTTDPVRMYMREMGSVELLTREGEIVIAKRIEAGLRESLQMLSTYPGCIASFLTLYDAVEAEEMRLNEVIRGFVEEVIEEEPTAEVDEDENDDSEVDEDDDEDVSAGDDDEDSGVVDPEEAKIRFDALKAAYSDYLKLDGEASEKARELASSLFMEFKLTPKALGLLNDEMTETVEEIRRQEKIIMDIVVEQARMNRRDFIDSFQGNEINTAWADKHIRAKKHYSSTIKKQLDTILACQEKLAAIQENCGISIADVKEISRQMSIAEAKARRAKKEMVEANLRLVISIAKKIH
jgi:RNA polymerase primary sigma factor